MRYAIWALLVLLVLIRLATTRPDYSDGDKIRITTIVGSEPVRYENSQGLKVSGLRTYLPKYPEIYYGDKVVVEGVVSDDKLENPQLISVDIGTGKLYKFRKTIIEFYQKSLPDTHASLVAGVTLGSKQSVSPVFWEALKKSGTVHVVVASGMNVTLVSGFLVSFLLVIMPRRSAIILALVGIWVYAFIAGFDAPIVRAAIMGSIGFVAIRLGRPSIAWRGLFISVIMMLIIKPSWVSDLGFILSFVATASIMLFDKRIENKLNFVPNLIRENFSTSLAAQIGVAPILWATFGQFNILSPFINALVLWTVAPITIIGMISALFALFVPQIARLILLIAYPLTSWFVFVVNFFS